MLGKTRVPGGAAVKARARSAVPAMAYDPEHRRFVSQLVVVLEDGRVFQSVSADGPTQMIEVTLPDRQRRRRTLRNRKVR